MKYILYLSIILRPSFWCMNYPYSKEWNDKLMELMRNNKFEAIGPHTAKIGNTEIWIANYPYASFNLYGADVRPSRWTIFHAQKKLTNDRFSN